MKRDATQDYLDSRAEADQEANEKVRNGTEQFHFLLETNPQIKDGLTWFQAQIMKHDFASIDVASKKNRMEHVDAYALQRDVNYAYSDRKRLFDMGYDSRFEEAYVAQVRYGVNVEDA